MNLGKKQSDLVLKFYEAAEEQDLWPQVMSGLSAMVGEVAINLWRFNHASGILEQKIDHGYDDNDQPGLYDSEIVPQCDLFRKMSCLTKSSVYHWNEVTSYDDLVNSILWHEWASKLPPPHTTARFALSSTISYQLNTASLKGFRALEDRERCLWDDLILPHLWQSLRLEHKLRKADNPSGGQGFEALDRLSTAAVSLSDQGLVLDVNQTAATIIAQKRWDRDTSARVWCAPVKRKRMN